jgi:hypothetical protein
LIEVGDWLAQRTPRPPAELAERLAMIAGDAKVHDEAALADVLVRHAVALLANVASDRSGATVLLLADALITYAMEAAASDHEKFEAIAERSMKVIAATAERSA